MKIVLLRGVAIVACTMLAVPACKTIDAYTGEEKTSNATTGAAIGAAVGAVLGIATSNDKKDRKRNALIGAGVGALAGGAVGHYMDEQEKELRRELAETGVSVTRDGDNLILNMPGNITFDTGKANLKPDFEKALDGVAMVLKKYEKTMIEVAGHTDSRGSDDYNQKLSEQRAETVANALSARKVEPLRLDPVGYGETNPIAVNNTKTGREQNRRVELTLLPLTES
ncbi:MAG: OmpA family protein [Gammaproteobacteria bacterium]|nr:OmpA family protein [Gammaproteobacteria bacterium]